MVAKVGGVVCTWPLAYTGRNTLDDWVKEIILMKTRLGIAHIGLGTDGGGRLPKTVKGYQNISDLPKLIKALTEAGLTQNEIQAYVGGNVERVVRACLVWRQFVSQILLEKRGTQFEIRPIKPKILFKTEIW